MSMLFEITGESLKESARGTFKKPCIRIALAVLFDMITAVTWKQNISGAVRLSAMEVIPFTLIFRSIHCAKLFEGA